MTEFHSGGRSLGMDNVLDRYDLYDHVSFFTLTFYSYFFLSYLFCTAAIEYACFILMRVVNAQNDMLKIDSGVGSFFRKWALQESEHAFRLPMRMYLNTFMLVSTLYIHQGAGYQITVEGLK